MTGLVGNFFYAGGAGADVFSFSASVLKGSDKVVGGGGTDQLLITTAGSVDASGVRGVEFYQLASGGANSLTLTDANFEGGDNPFMRTPAPLGVVGPLGVASGGGGATVSAGTLSAGHAVFLIGGVGVDSFVGGAGADVFSFTSVALSAADTVIGGADRDGLLLTTAGQVAASGVSGVEFWQLAGVGASSVAVIDANFVGIAGPLQVAGSGLDDMTVSGATLSASHTLYLFGGTGVDAFTGGAGADIFQFGSGALSAADRVIGGGGADALLLTTPGTVDVSGVSGVEFFRLASGPANTLVLRDSNFVGVTGGQIGVQAGNGGDTLDASGLGAGVQVFLFGGAGNDTLKGGAGGDVLVTGGGVDTLVGGTGLDNFVLSSSSGARIQNLTPGIDHIVLSDAGFDLGGNEGQGGAAYQDIAAGLLSTDALGGFTSASQHFAFDQAASHLLYSGTGSNADALLIATLTGMTTLDYHDLLFTA